MTVRYEPLVTASLAKQVAEKIRGSITDGRLKADDQLPTEEELAQQFQVSRPTIREALKRLAAQSLIRSRRGPSGGTFVNRPSQEEVRSNLTTATALLVSLGEFSIPEILEARQDLELVCVRHAVQRREESELAVMHEEIQTQEMSTVSDIDFCASDVRFHRAIADASHNPVLQFAMFTVIEALQPIENMVVFHVRQRDMIVKQHKKILTALRERKAAAAAQAVTEQMEYLRARFDEVHELRRQRISAQDEKYHSLGLGVAKENTRFSIDRVPPVGHNTRLAVVLDQALRDFGEIWAAGGMPTSVFGLTPVQLTELTGGLFADIPLAEATS